MSAMQKSKSKRSSKSYRKFLTVLFALVVFQALINIMCNGFVRYGGEFASANALPIYPDSLYIDAEYTGFEYIVKNSVYITDASPEELRRWFIEQNFSLSPIPKNLDSTEFYIHDGYYGTMTLIGGTNLLQDIHQIMAILSGHAPDFVRSCHGIRVYNDNEKFSMHFPNIEITQSQTVYVLSTCWLRVD